MSQKHLLPVFTERKYSCLGQFIEIFNILDQTILTATIPISGKLIITYKMPHVDIIRIHDLNDREKTELEKLLEFSLDCPINNESYYILLNNKVVSIIDVNIYESCFYLSYQKYLDVIVEHIPQTNVLNKEKLEKLLKPYDKSVQDALNNLLLSD